MTNTTKKVQHQILRTEAQRLRNVVPPSVISTFEYHELKPARRGGFGNDASQSSPSKKLVFGLLDKCMSEMNLVFIREHDANRLAKVHRAIHVAKTWGTFCRLMPAEDLKYIEDYYRTLDEPLPGKQEWFKLPPSFDDGDWPDWPEQMMLKFMPREIVAKYGQVPLTPLLLTIFSFEELVTRVFKVLF